MTRILALALVLWSSAALAHDNGSGAWISQNKLKNPATGEFCCNEQDCQAELVHEVRGGYRTQGGDIVHYSQVIWKSTDGRWWRCRYTGGEKTGKTRCLIGPPPGT